MLNKKIIGLMLIIIAITQFIIFTNIANQTRESLLSNIISEDGGVCKHLGEECPHEQVSLLNTLMIINYTTIILIFIMGIILILHKRAKKIKYNIPANLSEEEERIVNLLKESEGTMYQSGLVEKTGFTKVKITRTLDRLEGKKIIDRKRRGMTNIVILKQ